MTNSSVFQTGLDRASALFLTALSLVLGGALVGF